MFGETISSFNMSALEKLSDLPGMIFILNLIFLLDIYANSVLHFSLFSSWTIIQNKLSLGNSLGFIVLFSIYMAWILPTTKLFYDPIMLRILDKIRISTFESRYRNEIRFIKDSNYIRSYDLRYLAIKNNNLAALDLYNEWDRKRKARNNLKIFSFSLILLLTIDMFSGDYSLMRTIASSAKIHVWVSTVAVAFLEFLGVIFLGYHSYEPGSDDFICLPCDILKAIRGNDH